VQHHFKTSEKDFERCDWHVPETVWVSWGRISPEFGRTQYRRGAVVLTLKSTSKPLGFSSTSVHSADDLASIDSTTRSFSVRSRGRGSLTWEGQNLWRRDLNDLVGSLWL
jgi:hypothetical protein